LTVTIGDVALAESIARNSLDLLQKDPANGDQVPSALIALAIALRDQQRLPDALATAKEALQRARACGDEYLAAHALWHVGKIMLFQGERSTAIALLEESLALSRRIGAMASMFFATSMLAAIRIQSGEVQEATALLSELSRLWQNGGNKIESGAFWLGYVGALAARAGLDEHAAILYGFGYTFTGYCGVRGTIKPELEGVIADLRGRFDEPEFQALYDRGVDMSLDEAITLANDVFHCIEHGAVA
jgi:tetratricopeptide (TPR) repeat protein